MDDSRTAGRHAVVGVRGLSERGRATDSLIGSPPVEIPPLDRRGHKFGKKVGRAGKCGHPH
jgi:hypothetical protein